MHFQLCILSILCSRSSEKIARKISGYCANAMEKAAGQGKTISKTGFYYDLLHKIFRPK